MNQRHPVAEPAQADRGGATGGSAAGYEYICRGGAGNGGFPGTGKEVRQMLPHKRVEETAAGLSLERFNGQAGSRLMPGGLPGPAQRQHRGDKTSEFIPLTTLRAVEIMNEILPPGVINIVSGNGSLGAAIANSVKTGDGSGDPVLRFSDVEDALRRANDSNNGLGGSVWSSDLVRARELASRLECGPARVNSHAMIQPTMPFGGVKEAGLGVEFGCYGLEEYTNIQSLYIAKG
jgi:hypothetical protein